MELDLQALAAWVLAPGGVITVIGLFIREFTRSRHGKLTRAQVQTAESERLKKREARLIAYIYLLHARWPEGIPRPPWPRGLRPKD